MEGETLDAQHRGETEEKSNTNRRTHLIPWYEVIRPSSGGRCCTSLQGMERMTTLYTSKLIWGSIPSAWIGDLQVRQPYVHLLIIYWISIQDNGYLNNDRGTLNSPGCLYHPSTQFKPMTMWRIGSTSYFLLALLQSYYLPPWHKSPTGT